MFRKCSYITVIKMKNKETSKNYLLPVIIIGGDSVNII